MANTGKKIYLNLVKVTDDVNQFPLDINNDLCSVSGLAQAIKSNTITDPNYIVPFDDFTSCPVSVSEKWIAGPESCINDSDAVPIPTPIPYCIKVLSEPPYTDNMSNSICPSGAMTSEIFIFRLCDQYGNAVTATEDIYIEIIVDYRYVATDPSPPGEAPAGVTILSGTHENTFRSYTRDRDDGQGNCDTESEIYKRINTITPNTYNICVS